MAEINLDEFTSSDVRDVPDKLAGVVYKVETKKGEDVYGTAVRDEIKQKDFISILAQNDDFGITVRLNMQYYEKDKLTKLSQMGKYLNKYGNLRVGNVVELVRNDEGYYEVSLV